MFVSMSAVRACVQRCTWVYMRVSTCHMYVCMCVSVSVGVYVCIYVYNDAYLCVFVFAHMNAIDS